MSLCSAARAEWDLNWFPNLFGVANGHGRTIDINDIDFLPDGRMIVGGSFLSLEGDKRTYNLAVINPDRTLDTSFGGGDPLFEGGDFDPDFIAKNLVHVVRALPSGKILIGGRFKTYRGQPVESLIRVHGDGTLDNSFNISWIKQSQIEAIRTAFEGSVTALYVEQDGRIWIGGTNHNYDFVDGNILRVMPDGSMDPSFVRNTGSADQLRGVPSAFVKDGAKMLVVGAYDFDESYNQLIRLNQNGVRDRTLKPKSDCVIGYVSAAAVRENDYILASNFRVSSGGHPAYNAQVVAVDREGLCNHSFQKMTLAGTVNDLTFTHDGGILVSGGFNGVESGDFRAGVWDLVKMRPMGGVDERVLVNLSHRFNPTDGINCYGCSATVRKTPLGEFLVGWTMMNVRGVPRDGSFRKLSRSFYPPEFR